MRVKSKDRLLTNMLSYAVLQIVNMLVGLFLPRMYLEVYGSEINGVVSTINSFITYFSYLEAGLGLTLIHSLFKPLADNDVFGVNQRLTFAKKQYQKISYIYLVLVVGLSIIFPLISGTDTLETFEFIALIFVIGSFGTLDFYTMAKYRVLLTADRKEYVISFAMIIAQALRFVLTWCFLQLDISVALVKTIPIITLIIRSIILRIYIKKRYPQVSYNVEYKKDIVETKNRWDALFLQISITTSMSLPVILVSQMQGYKEANVYAVYNMVISAVVSIVSALSSGVSPMLGREIAAGGNVKKTYDIYEWIVSFALTIVFSVCSIMILPFIKLYVTVVNDINYIYWSYALLFSLWAALYSFRMPATALINATALYRENRVGNIVNLSIQVVLGIPLMIFFGINGLLVVMIIAALQRNLSMSYSIEKNAISGIFCKTIKRQIIMSLAIVFAFFIGLYCMHIEHVTWGLWIIYAIVSFIIVSVFSFLLFLVFDWKTMKGVVNLIKEKIKFKSKCK